MSENRSLFLWLLAGFCISLTLIPLITEAGGIQLYINIAAFVGIFAGGTILLTLIQWLTRRLLSKAKTRSETKIQFTKIATHSAKMMTAFMCLFGAYFYHAGIARYHIGEYSYNYSKPQKTNDGWQIASASEVGINNSVIERIVNRFVNDSSFKKQHSFVIVKDGKLVVDEYFYGHDINQVHDLRSANKSITSILIGIAIDKGYIKSVDEPIHRYLPEYRAIFNARPQKKKITIRHLLTMSSGQDANDWDRNSPGNENKYYQKKEDWIKLFLELAQVNSPGSQFSYSTLGENTLRQVLVNATQSALSEFADKHLFSPLNITHYKWTLSLFNRPDIPLRVELTSRDLAKLGQLFLNKGKWKNAQIVSSKWVEESTRAHIQTNEQRLNNPYFGYLWWMNDFALSLTNTVGFRAQGAGGQFMFAFPEYNLVVVFTSGNFGNKRQLNPFNILQTELLPEVLRGS